MRCWYQPGKLYPVTFVNDGGNCIYGLSREDIAERYPDAVLMDFEEALKQIETVAAENIRKPAKQIGKDRWNEMFEILPPMRWRSVGSAETFMLSERTYGDYTMIFCRIGDRFFEMVDDCSLTHDQIVSACSALISDAA